MANKPIDPVDPEDQRTEQQFQMLQELSTFICFDLRYGQFKALAVDLRHFATLYRRLYDDGEGYYL